MNQRTTTLLGVVIMSVLLLLYFFYAFQRAIALLTTGTWITITMGVSLLVLPLIGIWALLRELKFGRDATRLVDELDRAGQVPQEDIETLPSGKPLRDQAEQVFGKYREAAEQDESSWEAWARLGIMYDACGNRTEGRRAMRTAISLRKTGFHKAQ